MIRGYHLMLRGYELSTAKHLLLCSEKTRSHTVVSGWTLDQAWLLHHQPLSDFGKYKLEISLSKLMNLGR